MLVWFALDPRGRSTSGEELNVTKVERGPGGGLRPRNQWLRTRSGISREDVFGLRIGELDAAIRSERHRSAREGRVEHDEL